MSTASAAPSRFASGVALALAATVTSALQAVVIRYGAVRIDPMLYCTGAVIFAAICAAILLYHLGELRLVFDSRYALRLCGLAMAGTVMTTLTLVWGLRRIDAITGVLLMQSEPVYSLLLSILIMGERPSLRQLLATTVVLAGIGSVFAGGSFPPLYAAAMVLMTPLFWQTAHVLSLPVMPPLSPACITGGRFIYAAVVFVPILLLSSPHSLPTLADAHTLIPIAVTGAVCFFLGSITWYAAISRLSLSWTTALVVPGVPLLSTTLAIVLLGEHARARELIGIGIAVVGVLTLVLGVDASRKRPAGELAEAIHPSMS